MSDTIIQANIDEKTKAEATTVLEALGLSISDVIEATLNQIAAEKRLPAGLQLGPDAECPHHHKPNALTAATLDKSERGEGVGTAGDAEELFGRLGLSDA